MVIALSMAFFLCFGCSFFVGAYEENIDAYAEEFDFEAITDSIDSETKRILEEIGIDEISYEKLFSADVSKVADSLLNLGKNALNEPVEFLGVAVGIMLLTAVGRNLSGESEGAELVGSAVMGLYLAVPVAEVVTNSFSVLETLSGFTTVFSGVFCALVSSSGNLSLATSYSAAAILSDTLFSNILTGMCTPVISIMCSLSLLSCFDIYEFTGKLSRTVKQLYIFALGLIATFFSGIVSLKGVLGSGVDSLTARGVRFVVGRAVPIVGGAVSETYSALVAGLSMIKNTVGVFGIVTVVLGVLPTIMQIGAWFAALSLLALVSDFLGVGCILNMLRILKDVLVLSAATIIFSGVIFVVSVGVVIFIRGV